MKCGVGLTFVVLLICAGCGGGDATLQAIPIAPSSVEGVWTWKIGVGCDLLDGGFLDPDDGDEIFDVLQSGSRATADFIDRAGNRVVMDATLDAGCLQGTYTITEGRARVQGGGFVCDATAYTTSGGGTVQAIDLSTGAAITTIDVGGFPTRPCASSDGSLLFVPNGTGNYVSVIDTSTNQIIDTITSSQGELLNPSCCVSDGTNVYVGNGFQTDTFNIVTVIDESSRNIVDVIEVSGFGTSDILLTPDSSQVLVVNRDSRTIDVVSVALQQQVDTIPLEIAPMGGDVTPDGTRIIVAGEQGIMVCNLLAGDGLIVSEFPGRDVRVTPDGTAFAVTALPTAVVAGVTQQPTPLVRWYSLPGLTVTRTINQNEPVGGYGIDLCGDGRYGLIGRSAGLNTLLFDFNSTGDVPLSGYSPSEYVIIVERQLPPPRVFTFGFKFFLAINDQTGFPMADGDIIDQTTQSFGCRAPTWTFIQPFD